MNVAIEINDRVARISLNRQGSSTNSLDHQTVSALLTALERSVEDASAGSILLESDGAIFTSGLEPSESLLQSTPAELETIRLLLTFGCRSPKPLVVAVKGAALGAGLALVASAHVALAAQGTSFALTEIRLGQWPYLAWDVIERALGHRRALELALTSRVFSANDALTWGLIHEITQPSELSDRAFSTASLLAAAPPETIRQALAWVRDPSDRVDAAMRNLRSGDASEGLSAHLEKRRPAFTATK